MSASNFESIAYTHIKRMRRITKPTHPTPAHNPPNQPQTGAMAAGQRHQAPRRAGAALLLLLVAAVSSSSATATTTARVQALLAGMSLEQKVGQMLQLDLVGFLDPVTHELNRPLLEETLRDYHVGSILNSPFTLGPFAGKDGWTAGEWKGIVRGIHEAAMAQGEVPVLYGIDRWVGTERDEEHVLPAGWLAGSVYGPILSRIERGPFLTTAFIYTKTSVHGANYIYGATIFPQQINAAASFNRDLVREMGRCVSCLSLCVCMCVYNACSCGRWTEGPMTRQHNRITAKDTKAGGIPWLFAPILGINTQPLWSRSFEVRACEGGRRVRNKGHTRVFTLPSSKKTDLWRGPVCGGGDGEGHHHGYERQHMRERERSALSLRDHPHALLVVRRLPHGGLVDVSLHPIVSTAHTGIQHQDANSTFPPAAACMKHFVRPQSTREGDDTHTCTVQN